MQKAASSKHSLDSAKYTLKQYFSSTLVVVGFEIRVGFYVETESSDDSTKRQDRVDIFKES